jgi:hypothetical protein
LIKINIADLLFANSLTSVRDGELSTKQYFTNINSEGGTMSAYSECRAIRALDLDPIKVKLMDKESGEGWSVEKASLVEAEYRRFLFLIKTFPNEATAPLRDVDTFWHYHILDTMKYAHDCESVFGYFLHHFPYAGLRGADDTAAQERLGERMKNMYEHIFGREYKLAALSEGAAPAGDRKQAGIAFCAAPAISGVAFCAAPATTGVAFCAAPATPRIAFCAAPAEPAKAGTAWGTTAPEPVDDFFSTRPQLKPLVNA